jgi:hypothetical protein
VLARVERANTLLEAELAEVAEKFDLSATWYFSGRTTDADPVVPRLRINADGHPAGSLTFPPGALKDDETVLRHLRPFFTELGRYLSGLVKHQFAELRKKLEDDLEAFSTLPRE